MKPEQMAVIDSKLDFKDWGNAEVVTEWFVLSINSNYTAVKPQMEKFLFKIGRRKFLVPIYGAMKDAKPWNAWGKEVYLKSRNNYHPVSNMTLDEMWGIKKK